MRYAFLLPGLEPSGGVAVVRSYAERIGADLLTVADLPVSGEPYDVAVGTWWETAERLFDVPAARHAMFLQSLEHRFYGPEQPWERLGAAAVLGLPVAYIAISTWIRDVVAEVRPDAAVHLVPNGIDKEVFEFRERPAGSGPLRVLVDGQPELPFKGAREAIAAVEAMTEPHELSTVAPTDGLDAAGMAALYARHDVLVKLARVEGLGLGPIEAAHVGTPSVVTPYTGHEDFIRDGENGVVVGFDDIPGTAAALDGLARDRALLARLGEGAHMAAAGWPSAVGAANRMADVLEEIAEAPPAEPGPALTRLLAGLRVEAELGREELAVSARRAERIDALEGRIEDITSKPAYRAASAIRKKLP